MARDDLGDRMKRYENVSRTHLTPRMPVIIRIDGKAFHTFTRGFKKPFDDILIKSMQQTMKYLCEHIQGCVLGYTQSDEITLVLVDYRKLNSAAWFDYNIQKCASIAASMATMAFNKYFGDNAIEWCKDFMDAWNTTKEDNSYFEVLNKAMDTGAMFDARVFNVPKEEVCNCLLWRQLDATRNSIQMVGRANFSHKEMDHKTCDDIQEMLFSKFSINWNDYATHLKRGSCCVRKQDENGRGKWIVDKEIPKFVNDGRSYVDNLVLFETESE